MSEEVIKFKSPRRQVKEEFKIIDTQKISDVRIQWFGKFTKNREKIMFCWKFFPGDKLQNEGIDFLVGHIKAYPHPTFNDFKPFEFDFSVNGAEHKETREYEYLTKKDWCCATYECELTPYRLYGNMFGASTKHDGVLVVEKKKLNVSKAFLSYHSDFFSDLFSRESHSKEIPIEGVTYFEFGLSMSCIHPDHIVFPNYETVSKLLSLADRFSMRAVYRMVEHHLLHSSSNMGIREVIKTADQYGMKELMEKLISRITSTEKVMELIQSAEFPELSAETKAKLMDCMAKMMR